jgi:lipoate-protein ligase B
MIDTAAGFGVMATRRDGYPGIWCDVEATTPGITTPSSATATTPAAPRKLGALGLRVEGGVTYHGIALNVTTNLDDFALINACGMPDAQPTSIAMEAGWSAHDSTPSTASVAQAADRFAIDFAERLEEVSQGQPLAVGAGI